MGNDVVDLKEPVNIGKSRDQRFLGRVFTASERERIAGALSPDRLLWALWAAKEAAYKAVSRFDPQVCSIPRRYPVRFDPADQTRAVAVLAGRVTTPRGELPVEVSVAEEWVHAVVAGPPYAIDRICRVVETVEEGERGADPSAFVRAALLQEIARRSGCSPADLSVLPRPGASGAPVVHCRGEFLTDGVSLSHDGRFAAFAFDPALLTPPDCRGV